jgi:tetratricopeptide (TPR) repeat protein
MLENNVEDFVLVWLDTRTPQAVVREKTHKENIKRQSQLQTIINFTRTFNDADDCRTFIQSSKTEKVFLIACGYLGEFFVPTIHALSQLEVVYIFCTDQRQHTKWAKSYSKVRAVCTTTNELLTSLSKDVSMYAKNLTPLSIFAADLSREVSLRSLKAEEVRFMWFQLLLQLIIRMPPNKIAQNDMRTECEQAYRGNVLELVRIDEFFRTYTPDSCIRWYTKDSFIYRLLNKAFRTENIDIIFKFRFFIVDLYHQLKLLHRPFTGTVYRGQTMSPEELQLLKDSIDKFVSINAFFSTTKSSNRAISFSGEGSGLPRFESVVFQIEIEEHITDTQPFADVAHFSSMSDEDEILFSMNTIFRLVGVEKWGSIWMVHLILCNENEQSMKDLVDHFKKEIDEDQMPPLLMLGEFLWKMGDFGRANRYYKMMLKELPSEHELIGKVFNNIGLISLENGDFRLAMHYFNKALRLQKPTETLDLAETYSNMGVLYNQQGETDQALKFTRRSLDIQVRLLPHNHKLVGSTYNNIGWIYFQRRDFDEALRFYEKARSIECVALGSSDHFDHATTLSNIGLVHYEQGHYELALSFYKEALVIQERSLPAQHPQFADIYTNIGTVQEKLGELSEALVMFNKALEVRLVALSLNHPSIAESYNNLANVLDALGKSEDALTNYFKALKHSKGISLEIRSLRATILNNIAETYRNQDEFVEANKYHQKALRIRLKLYSRKKHPDLAMSYNNIALLFYYQYKFDKALSYHFRSLAIRREVYEPLHPRLALSLFNIGLVYSEKGECEHALEYLKQAIDIQKQALPANHESIIATEDEISFVTQKLKILKKRSTKGTSK